MTTIDMIMVWTLAVLLFSSQIGYPLYRILDELKKMNERNQP